VDGAPEQVEAGGPYEMQIQAGTRLREDVLVGEVWVGSGQSNMAFTVSKKVASYAGMLDEEKEITAANYRRFAFYGEGAEGLYAAG